MVNDKVIYVHINDTSRRQQDYFFGSVLAIYDILSEDELGIKYNHLLIALKAKGTYTNPYARIIVGDIIRRKWSKNKKRNETE